MVKVKKSAILVRCQASWGFGELNQHSFLQTFCHWATKQIEKKEVNWTYIVKILKIFVKILKPQNWEKTRIGNWDRM
jgi:hypothetical protein